MKDASGKTDRRERRCLRKARGGDRRAFEELYVRYSPRIYALSLRLLADPEQAAALTQDAFVRAWEKLTSFRGRGPFGAWLSRLTVNLHIQEQRRQARQRRGRAALAEETVGPAAETGASGGLRMDLERAVATLPPGARLVFVLHDVEGYPLAEIATLNESSLGTVKSQLHRARRLLRERLGGEAGKAEA